jgi:hypothetical protein
MTATNKVAIVIPFYAEQLSHFEKIALLQCEKVLSGYPKIAIKPKGLSLPAEVSVLSNLSTISFDHEYFKNIWGYNRLMMSAVFYSSFAEYEYILIHQLDAFVFKDDLNYWCGQNFDYIGAPWLRAKPHSSLFSSYWHRFKNYWYMRNNTNKKGLPRNEQLEDRVGNGGFSLRRVSLFVEYCVKFKPLIERYQAAEGSWFHEDIFWSIELNRKQHRLRIPSLKNALHFAFETNPARALQINQNELPFGCHAWDKERDFWRPIFEELGYDI